MRPKLPSILLPLSLSFFKKLVSLNVAVTHTYHIPSRFLEVLKTKSNGVIYSLPNSSLNGRSNFELCCFFFCVSFQVHGQFILKPLGNCVFIIYLYLET